jgi:hypothetical protein
LAARDDIDLWELGEAFASQWLGCRDTLGIDSDRYNVDCGSISVGHPFGQDGRALRGPSSWKAGAERRIGASSRCASVPVGAPRGNGLQNMVNRQPPLAAVCARWM